MTTLFDPGSWPYLGLLSWLAAGWVVAFLSRATTPGGEPGGCIGAFVFGGVGGVAGGLIAAELGFGSLYEVSLEALLVAVVGAVFLVFMARILRGG